MDLHHIFSLGFVLQDEKRSPHGAHLIERYQIFQSADIAAFEALNGVLFLLQRVFVWSAHNLYTVDLPKRLGDFYYTRRFPRAAPTPPGLLAAALRTAVRKRQPYFLIQPSSNL